MAWYIGAQQSYEDVSSKVYFDWPFSEEEVAVIDITFAHSGTAVFYTSGDEDDTGAAMDTIGYLNDYGAKLDENYGEPFRYIAENDDGGDGYNFRIEYDVEAGVQYFLYYRHLSPSSSGYINLTILPPESDDEGYYQPSYDDMEVDASANGTTITVHVTGFDEDYNGVWEIRYGVYEKDTGTNIVARTLRSDSDLSFDKVTFDSMDGIAPGTTYQIYVLLTPYPGEDSGVNSWITWEPREVTTGGSSARPAKFKWADGKTTKTSGQTFDITAREWCGFLDNINSVRAYKGYSQFSQGSYTLSAYYNYFTYPATGQPFRYQHYNQALNAITGMLGYGYADNSVKQGDLVTADRINLLVEWLNGIT